MAKMKDSCIEWIGEIPEGWKKESIRNLLLSRDGGAWGNEPKDEEGTICLRIADFDYDNGCFKKCDTANLTRRVYTKTQIKNLALKCGDILIEKSGGGEKTPVGRTVLYNGEYGPVLYANFMERLRFNNEKVNSTYIEYWMKAWYSCRCSPYYVNQTTGIQNLSLSLMIAKERVFYPELATQHKIADFLDAKCSKIDALKKDITAQIEILEQYKKSVITEAVTKGLNPDVKMKDTGIEWIGEIPEHWKIQKGKYILEYLEKPVKETDGVITCFRDGEVTLRSKRREEGFTISEKEIGYQGIDVGDLVVHGMDGFAGSIGISDSRGKASPVLNVLDSKQNKKYLMYYLRSMAYGDVFLALATGIRVRSCDLRWNKLANLPYPIPPIDEQNQIVAYIDSTLSKTNLIITAKKQQLAKLEDYKKSLIYEYVTGKKQVSL